MSDSLFGGIVSRLSLIHLWKVMISAERKLFLSALREAVDLVRQAKIYRHWQRVQKFLKAKDFHL